mmetsp:Transcript_7362/g.9336  ORF Transcript_7362/g.9336 Transcript_7362/m.9336 type:complete len:128 (+) Transcript_7362:65-448(+)
MCNMVVSTLPRMSRTISDEKIRLEQNPLRKSRGRRLRRSLSTSPTHLKPHPPSSIPSAIDTKNDVRIPFDIVVSNDHGAKMIIARDVDLIPKFCYNSQLAAEKMNDTSTHRYASWLSDSSRKCATYF